MAFTYQVCIIAAVICMFGVTNTSAGCAEELMACTKDMGKLAQAGSSGNAAGACKTVTDMMNCFKNMDVDSCPASLKSSFQLQLKTGEKQLGQFCGQSGSGGDGNRSGGDNGSAECMGKFQKCNKLQDDHCKMFECVEGVRKTGCGIPDQIKSKYNEIKAKCGSCNLQSSALFVLVCAMLVAIRSFF